MFQGRRLCKISLLVIFAIVLSAYSPWDILGVYAEAEAVEHNLSIGEMVYASGEIYHKEIKNDKTIYFVKNGKVNLSTGTLTNTSFIFKYDSDSIPNHSKLNIKGTASLFTEARNEGGFNEKEYYYSLGLFFKLESPSVLSCETRFPYTSDMLYRINKGISRVYQEVLPNEEAGFLSSVAIGNKSELLGDLKELFQLVGVAHVLAVSGLHVSIICMAFYKILRRRGVSFAISGTLAGLIAIFYGMLTGGSVSSTRAIGMFLVLMLADITGETYDFLTALCLLADILLIFNPLYIKNVSFLFSFGAMLGIYYVAIPFNKKYGDYCRIRLSLQKSDDGFKQVNKKSLPRKGVEHLVSSVIFSIGINIAMIPIVTAFYRELPLYSVVINIFILPLMPVILVLGLIGGVVGLFYLMAARVFLFPCHFIIYFFEMIASMFARLPKSRIIVGHKGIVYTFIYFAIVLALIHGRDFLNKHSRKDTNPRKDLMSIRKEIVLTLVGFVIIEALWLAPVGHRFEVDIIDVGQGDGIYVSSGDGVNFFIDGGSTSSDAVGKYTILPFLKYKGVASIDYWFVSHMDMDHVSGLMELLEEGYRVKYIVLSSEIMPQESLSELLNLADINGTDIIYMKKGDECGTKHLTFKCIFPGPGYSSDDINALSLSLLMEYDKNLDGCVDYSGFFGGDLGQEQERIIAESGLVGHVDLLKVSHHGSRYSSDEVFLSTLKPDVAVISCGKKNNYGHPSKEAIDRLEASAGSIYYTMYSGRIRAQMDEVDLFIN